MAPFDRRPVGYRSQRKFVYQFVLAGLIAGLVDTTATSEVCAEFVGPSALSEAAPVEGGGFRYGYSITNTSSVEGGPALVAWGMPFFDDAATSFINGEASIFAPEGWTWLFTELTGGTDDDELWPYVAADDPKNADYGAPGSAFDNPPFALLFFVDFFAEVTDGILPGETVGVFGYESSFGGANVPFIAAFDNLQLTIGDPVGPRTPSFPAAQGVPEPTSLVLLATGGLTVVLAARLRRRKR